MVYHSPVMESEVVEGLVKNPMGVYVDATAGGGGHSRALLQRLGPTGRVVALDRDPDAIDYLLDVSKEFSGRLTVLQGNFKDLHSLLESAEEATAVSGVLFDLGVSSHQIDEAGRGFTYQQVGPLDMRMDRSAGVPAVDLLAQISEADLVDVIKRFGEERQARRIARAICARRRAGNLKSTSDLRVAVESTHPQILQKTLARVFQALRIAVNGELEALDLALEAAIQLLLPGGRLAVISYHSLEDRLVKRKLTALIRGCICPPRMPICACGRIPLFSSVHNRKTASQCELDRNPRARSAGLRLFEKCVSFDRNP